MGKLIQLHPDDNVLVVRRKILAGDREEIHGTLVQFEGAIELGHKLVGRRIAKNESIIKYGVSIGSATKDIAIGEHVHLHNMKSEYIPTFSFDNQFEDGQ